jgi:DNA helicase-2/ATP-dependent DNA helicase PcrA
VAGGAKTTTLVEATRRWPYIQKAVFVAFNKSIADELKRRMYGSWQARTLHSLGLWITKTHLGDVTVDSSKIRTLLMQELGIDEVKKYFGFRGLLAAVGRLVSGLKSGLVGISGNGKVDRGQVIPRVLPMADFFDIDLPVYGEKPSEFAELVADVYERSLLETSMIDFDDMIAMPAMYAQSIRFPHYDVLLVDEAQDLNHSQHVLIENLRPGRVLAVGDRFQAIYGWRGAMSNAMDVISDTFNTVNLPLSICYRCDLEIIREAQKLVPEIQARPGAEQGVVRAINERHLADEVQDGDFVLCRTTAPLIDLCLRLMLRGVRARVKGRDVGKRLQETIEKVAKEPICSEELSDRIRAWRRAMHDKYEGTEKEGRLVAIDDRSDSVLAFAGRYKDSEEIINAVSSLFVDGESGVTLSTVHKAKGLEADRVFLIRPDLIPHPYAKSQAQRAQERNIKYVAITRARHELVYVERDVREEV